MGKERTEGTAMTAAKEEATSSVGLGAEKRVTGLSLESQPKKTAQKKKVRETSTNVLTSWPTALKLRSQ